MPITLEKPKKTNPKRSYRAKQVARDVLEKVRRREHVNLTEIQKANGYSVSSARSMKAIETLSYQEEIAPVINSMQRLRDKVLASLHAKNLDDAKVFDLNLLLKNLNHDTQLLQGKSTNNTASINKIIVYGTDDFLAKQLDQ